MLGVFLSVRLLKVHWWTKGYALKIPPSLHILICKISTTCYKTHYNTSAHQHSIFQRDRYSNLRIAPISCILCNIARCVTSSAPKHHLQWIVRHVMMNLPHHPSYGSLPAMYWAEKTTLGFEEGSTGSY